MRRWWLVIALVLSVGINIGWIAQGLLDPNKTPPADELPAPGPEPGAERPPGRHGEGPSPDLFIGVFERIANELALEGEPRQQFLELQRAFVTRVLEGHEQVRTLRQQLRSELTGETPDRARIDELLESTAAAELEREKAFIDNLLATRELLDPEQDRRFMSFVERLRDLRQIGRRWHGEPEGREGFGPRRPRRPFGDRPFGGPGRFGERPAPGGAENPPDPDSSPHPE